MLNCCELLGECTLTYFRTRKNLQGLAQEALALLNSIERTGNVEAGFSLYRSVLSEAKVEVA
jgi:hypothetical protein